MKIVLIRHGKTEGNIRKRYIGRTDEPLCENAGLGVNYPECETVIASPLIRCRQTAKLIYPKQKIKFCEDLRECDFGDFENKSYEDLKTNPDYIRWLKSHGTLPFPNGEAHEEFKMRCILGFKNMLDDGHESAAFVIHGGTIMAIMQALFGGGFYDYSIKNGGMFAFEYDVRTEKATGNYERREEE